MEQLFKEMMHLNMRQYTKNMIGHMTNISRVHFAMQKNIDGQKNPDGPRNLKKKLLNSLH